MFKLSRQEKDHRYFCGNKYEKYSIKKLKIGAASVLVGTGFLFGYNLDQVSANEQSTETTTIVTSKDGDGAQSTDKLNLTTEPKQENTPEVVTETLKPETKEEAVLATSPQVAETKETPETKEVSENKANSVDKETINSSTLLANLADLEAQIERIRGNKKQASQIQNAEKLVADARQYLEALNTTQKEVDAKAKEISSLTSILKSIKAEETVKENKNTDSRNGKNMQEGVGFRTDTAAGTGVGADVKDATSTPAVTRDGYTDRAAAESFTKQVTWLDFGDTANWQNIDNEGGKIYLKEGSIYSKEVIPGYVINIKVKSLKPFQATEIYRKRMEAANASEEEKATFNPNATNQHFGDERGATRITADKQDDTWSEIRNNGINTGNKKTAIGSESDWSNVGIQFEISATYKGKNVRPAVVMNDSESANHGENIIFTTNGSPWERVLELKKERFVGGSFTSTPYKPINNYNLRHEDYPQSGGRNNAGQLLWYLRGGLLTFSDGRKLAPKYFTNPDQETGGLGTGVFGPVTTSGGYSLPVLMTKDATEVGLYILSSGIQTAMMGVIPIDEGDAPESYGKASHTINTVNGVTGAEVKQPYLGSTRPDMDTGTTKDWYGDDKDLDGDEGVNQLLPENLKGSEGNIIKANISNAGHYTLNVQAHTGGAEKAYIRSWIDFNKNGQFDADEASEIATVTQDGTVKLNFKNKISTDAETLLEAGARVRIATVESEIENPTGTAFSGEVEDFIAKITHPPKGEKKTTIGNIKETQREEIQFTAQGRNVYLEDHSYAEIDTTVQPTYIDNKTGQEVTLASDGTYTVEGEGTYKFAISDNGKDVKVEFTPADGFVGKANGITIRRQDTNKTTTDWGTPDATTLPNVNDSLNTMDGLYIPEVTVPTSVNATPVNADSQNLQGLPQKGQPTFNVESAKAPVTASAKYPAKLVDPRTNAVTELTTVDALENGTTNKIGTYTIVPETGEVTFTPNKDFKGIPAPATISADVELTHDKDGNITKKTLTANYTPTIIPVVPTAEASTTSDIIGKKQVSPIKLDTEETGDDKGKTVNFNKGAQTGPNGERVELNPDTLTLLDGENEVTSVTTTDGKYELDKANKTITFTPNATFTGVAKPVSVRIKDANGTKVDTTYTPTVTDVTMEGTPKETEAPQGQTQTGTPEFTVSNPDVRITGYKLINPTTNTPVEDEEIDVPNQGTYRIDKTTGTVKFIPKAGFTGPADGINVQAVTDVGKTHEAKYTPTVNPFVIIAVSQESKNIQGVPQEGTPTFTIPEELTNASITSRKLVDPTDNAPKDSVTVEGKGTFVIDETGKVTFTPVPSYTGEVPAIEVQATVTVTNEKNEPATITSKATYKPEIVPVELGKTPATSTNLQGLEQKGTPTFTGSTVEVNGEQKEVTITPNSYTLVKDGAEVTTTPAYKKGTTEEIGTYTIDPATGEVTLTPTDKTYTGEVEPAVVQATGSNNVKVQTTYTPTITPVTPTAEASRTSGVQGKPQTSPIVLDTEETGDDKGKTVNFNKGTEKGPKEERVELNPDTLTLLDGENEVTSVTTADGKYELDKANKTITFTPNATFTGEAKPVNVRIKDMNGTKVDTTYTPTVIDVTMEGTPKETEAPQGKTQTGKPEFKISSPDVRITGYKLVDPVSKKPVDGTEIEVPEQGTYKIDPTTGQVTFIPKAGFTGPATGITVQATDENGETKDAKYTPTVNPLTVTPENKTSKNIQGVPQEGTPTFTIPEGVTNASITSRKLVDPTDNTPKDSVTVEGKGTFVIDETGKVTFTPVPSYTGEVPAIEVEATVTVTNEKNEPATITSKATYKPEIVPLELGKTPATSTNLQGLEQKGTPTFTGSTVEVNGEQKEVTITPNSYTLVKDGAEVTTTPAYKKGTTEEIGTYTIDPATGEVTLTPTDKTYTGEVEPAVVQATGSNNVKVQTTYTPTITPVTPTAEASRTSGVQGKPQTSPIVLDTEETGDDKGKTVNFNKGTEKGPKEERVELNPDTLTLLDGENEVTSVTTADGKYELDKANKTITFTPNATFTGEAKPVNVRIKDMNGTKVETTYTPTVIEVTPTGKDSATSGLQGFTQTSPIVFNQKDEADNTTVNFETGHERVELKQDTLTLVNENGEKVTTITVPAVGTYELKDGAITFTPVKTFTGTAEGVTVQVEDENGKVVTKKYVPTVTPVTPEGENAETEGPKAQPQTSTIVFDKKDEDNATVNFNKGHESVTLDPTTTTLVGKDGTPTTEVKVPGEGTYTLANNVITFTPEPEFAGKATGVTVQVKDVNGTVVTKTYTPTVRPVTTFVDEAGNSITVDKNNTPVVPEEDGKQPNKDIYGYKFVRTETDNKGNTKHVYELAKGQSVKVTYETTTGEELKDPATVQPKDTLVGTDYDASTETIKLERIEKDGKVYLLKERKADSASENGKVSDKEQTITYVYEEVKEPAPKQNYGSVVVVYTDKFGRPISGITDTGKEVGSTVVDTPNSPLNAKYDTTDNRPQTITTKDGKVYTLKKVTKDSDAEQSGVKGRTSVVTYVYEILNNTEEFPEAHIGVVLVNYHDEEGNPISGKTPEGKVIPNVVVDTDATLVGEKYDTTDNKPTVIIAENGDVYELVKASATSVETGEVVEGATIVDYIYRKVVTTFVDENGNELKSSEKGSKNKSDISGYVFKETKKDEKGNTVHVYQKVSTPREENESKVNKPSEKVTSSNPSTSTPSIDSVLTTFVDENGNVIIREENGSHPGREIEGYELIGIKRDSRGNVRNVYRKIQSQKPVQPVEPATPAMPEQPAKSEVPATPAQPVQTAVVKEAESKRELPNTGTEDHANLAALGLLGVLSGFGLVARKKKED